MRARAGWFLLLLTLSTVFGGGRQGMWLESYRTALIESAAERDFEWMALAAFVRRSRSQPGGRRGGGPVGSQLPTTYYNANLPVSGDGRIRYNANSVADPFPGTIMNTYDGQAGPPCGAAQGFRDVPCANSAALISAISPGTLVAGDLIKLTPGVRYTGTLNNWATLSAYCVIESSGMTGAPPRGTRATAAHASNMAIIETSSGNNGRAVDIQALKGYVWFRYVKFECNAGTAFTDKFVHLGRLLNAPFTVNDMGPNDFAQRVVFDRILVNVDPSVNAVKNFVTAECHYFAILDSTVREIFHGVNNVDSRCVYLAVSSGPVKLINNELNGASQSFLTGGAGLGPAAVERPSTWEVRQNWLTKSSARKGQVYGGVTYTAGFNAEHKDMQGALWFGNVLQYCWASYKGGEVISLSNYSAGGQDEQVRDVVIAYNRILDVGSGIQLYQDNATNQAHERVVVAHNTVDRFNVAPMTGNARQIQVTALTAQMGALTFVHHSSNGASATHAILLGRGSGEAFLASAFTARKMNMRRGSFGVFESGNAEGNASINITAAAPVFEWNLLIGGSGNPYPANNICPATLADCFQDAGTGDLSIPPASPHLNYGGGSDLYNSPGADVPRVLVFTAGAVSGVWT